MKTKHVSLNLDLWLSTKTKGNEDCLDLIGYDIIHEYLNIRIEEQHKDKEGFEDENGYNIEDYKITIKEE